MRNFLLFVLLLICCLVLQASEKKYNGKGRVILPKNIDGGTNILTQDMFLKGKTGHRVPNTNAIFVIKYDFTLAEDITIPANCVLEFDGGSISNGCITGDKTQIKAHETTIFTGITFSGTWNVPEITTLWFGDAGKLDVLKEAFNLTDDSVDNIITVENGEHLVSISEWGGSAICVRSNTKVNLIGDIILNTTIHGRYNIVDIAGVENVSVCGRGRIVGDLDTHIRGLHDGYSGEWGFGIRITESNNVQIDGITVCKCWGDCIMVGETRFSSEPFMTKDATKHTKITNITLHSAIRQGISVTHSEECTIKNVHIYNIHRSSYNNLGPGAGIDIEPDIAMWVKNVSMSDVSIHDCDLGIQTYCKIPLTFETDTTFPATGNNDVIYIDNSTNKHFKWSSKNGFYEIDITNKPKIEDISIENVDIADISFKITPPSGHKSFGLYISNVQNLSVRNSSFNLSGSDKMSLYGSCVQIRNCSDNISFNNVTAKGSVEAFYIGVPVHGKAVGSVSVKNSCFENPEGSNVCCFRDCNINFVNTRFLGSKSVLSNTEAIYPWRGCKCKFEECLFDVGVIKSMTKDFEIVNSNINCSKILLSEGNRIKKSEIIADVNKFSNSSYGITGSSFLLSDCIINTTIEANGGCHILNNKIILSAHLNEGFEESHIICADDNKNDIRGNIIEYK